LISIVAKASSISRRSSAATGDRQPSGCHQGVRFGATWNRHDPRLLGQ
jgi:hypothetical protein